MDILWTPAADGDMDRLDVDTQFRVWDALDEIVAGTHRSKTWRLDAVTEHVRGTPLGQDLWVFWALDGPDVRVLRVAATPT